MPRRCDEHSDAPPLRAIHRMGRACEEVLIWAQSNQDERLIVACESTSLDMSGSNSERCCVHPLPHAPARYTQRPYIRCLLRPPGCEYAIPEQRGQPGAACSTSHRVASRGTVWGSRLIRRKSDAAPAPSPPSLPRMLAHVVVGAILRRILWP